MTYQSAIVYLQDQVPENFFLSKMNAGIKGWDEAMAGMCQLNYMLKTEKAITDFDTLIKLYMLLDPHLIIEAHLPSVCPLSLVEKVIIKKSDYAKLSSEAKKKLKSLYVEGETLIFGDEDDDVKHLALASQHLILDEARMGKYDRGFAFTLEAEFGNDHVLPLAFENPGKGTIEFRVRGQGFRIGILNESDPLVETNSSEAIIFGIDTMDRGLKTSFYHGYKTQPKYVEDDFLWGCDLDAFIYFIVEYEAGKGVRITNRANQRVITYRDDSTTKLSYVSVSCWRDSVAFKAFFIH